MRTRHTLGRFSPEVLGTTASRGLVILTLEVLIIKLTLYLLQSKGVLAPEPPEPSAQLSAT